MAEISKEIGLDDAIRGIGMGGGATSSDDDVDEKSGSRSGLFKGGDTSGKAKEIETIR